MCSQDSLSFGQLLLTGLRAALASNLGSVPERNKRFFFSLVSTGTHPCPYSLDTGGAFSRVNRPERVSDHSLPSRAQVTNEWNYTSTSPYAFTKRTGSNLLFILSLLFFLYVWAAIAQLVSRLGTDWTVRGSNPGWGGWARFSAPVQTCPGTHPASYTMGTGTYVVGSKSFRPDQLFKVTEIKTTLLFST